MGRANQRPRKTKKKAKKKPQHLNKVGTATDVRTEGRRERGAMMDVMGLGNRGAGTRSVLFIIGVLIMVAAILALLVFNTF